MWRLLALAVLVVVSPASLAQTPPSYSRQVQPFFTRYCVECHNAVEPEGGLNLESFKTLMEGGGRGPSIVPGKPDSSRLVRMIEGKLKPVMPPNKSKQPPAAEVATIRAWVLAGARDDSTASRVSLPAIAARVKVHTPVSALAYSPDGKILAASGRGEVLLLDEKGEVTTRLRAGRDRVTALAIDRKSAALAVAASTAGQGHEVRLWRSAHPSLADSPGTLTIKHDDLIHALAFSPDGKLLASASYDRLIRLWDLQASKEIRVLRDHSDSVYGLSFSPDGKLLASGGADRAVKVWDLATGNRLYTLGESTDWVYAVAWSPDGKHLAAAGVDRSIRVWEVDRKGGRIVHSVFAHEGAITRLSYRADGKKLWSLSEDRTAKSWDTDTMVERQVYPKQPEVPLALAVHPESKELALGRYDGALVVLDPATGKTIREPLPIKPRPPLNETEPNDSPRTGQLITLPLTIAGTIGRAGDLDWFRFEAKPTQEVGVHATAIGSPKLDPYLRLVDPDGNIVAESTTGRLGHICTKAGLYYLGLRDAEYRGATGMSYQLRIGDVPVVTSFFPIGVQRGTEADVHIQGVHLGKEKTIRIKAPASAAVGSRLPIPLRAGIQGAPALVVGEFPEVTSAKKERTLPLPGTANGVITEPGRGETWPFQAKKGQRLILEVNAARIDSPLDSTIEILDGTGRPLPRATLRSTARTFVTFRDHDSRGPGIRIEAWSELAVNDWMLVGSELVRIRALPRNPDDDCQFFSEQGQRLGFLGTTPAFQSQGTPMYKVAIHPPGTRFPPNGLPIVTLFWRNDDGGPGLGKDSRLVFDPPADGIYTVRVGDARGEGSPAHAYRLTVRPPRPDFHVRFSVAGQVSKGGAVPVRVDVTRLDEFDGVIDLKLNGLPAGFEAPPTNVPAGENSTAFSLFAQADAIAPKEMVNLELEARGRIAGKEVVRKATGKLPRLIEPGDIIASTEENDLTIRPGGEARITMKVERRKGFTGRIPLEVQGLPHGVRVLDVGLNGILITPAETRRTFVLYCEPWVQPMNHPIVILARQEGKGTEYAARSVLLRVVAEPRSK